MKRFTKLELLWIKDPLTVEEAAMILTGGSERAAETAGKLLAADIENGKLDAKIVRFPEYDFDWGCEVDRGRGHIDQYETTIALKDFKAYYQSIKLKVEENQTGNTNTAAIGSDWKMQAREIGDELFEHDTACGCRDSLDGYSKRVMEEMQKRGIQGPRGIFDNPNTIKRDALQGSQWWGNKQK